MRLGFIVALFVVLLIGSSWMATEAFSLMNRPSDGSVGVGVLVLSGLAFSWIGLFVGAKQKLCNPGTLTFTPAAQQWFKKLFLFSMIVICPTLSGCMCTRIDAGHVGIKVELAGSDRGVQDIPQVTGWVFYNFLTEQVFEFPTYVQTAIWSASPHEGSSNNEEIIFNSKKGMIISADVSLSYRLEPTKVPAFYVKFRTDRLDNFTHGMLRNVARDAFNDVGSNFETEEIYGAKKGVLLHEVTKMVNDKVNPYGIIIEQLGFVGAPRLPQAVVDSLNASQAAIQKSIQTENEIRQVNAEAQKNIAESAGRAKASLQQAQAAADAKLMAAKAEAESNLLLSKSITPELIKWKTISVMEKWDGKRPMVEGSGANPFILQMPLTEPVAK